ncbi:hypothetical protein PV325_011439, partial [Microctonus aethiopoides]
KMNKQINIKILEDMKKKIDVMMEFIKSSSGPENLTSASILSPSSSPPSPPPPLPLPSPPLSPLASPPPSISPPASIPSVNSEMPKRWARGRSRGRMNPFGN